MKPPEEQIPSKAAIIPYYLLAAISFVVISILCLVSAPAFIGHYFQPSILAVTHLAVFGWATMIIFGASNQLTPVICEQKLFSEKIPVLVLALLVSGTILLVTGFWTFSIGWLMYTGGALLISAIVLHALNITKTASAGKGAIVRDFLIIAHTWLIITCTIGLLLLVNLGHPFLPADHLHYLKTHASIGMAGWFLQLVIGVSSRLVPMFLLSRHEDKKLLNISYYTINTGLALFLLEGLIRTTTHGAPLYFSIVLAGITSYLIYIRRCYTTAIRKQIDNGMKLTFMALVLMSAPFVLLCIILLAGNDVAPNVFLAYGVSFFAGFISVIIMGQTFKTLPFIVWMHITEPDKLPELFPKDLFRENWVKGHMTTYFMAYLFFLTGILLKYLPLIYMGSVLMVAAAMWYFIHVILIVKKLRK